MNDIINDGKYSISIQVHDRIGPVEESLSQEVSDAQINLIQNLRPTPSNITQINIKPTQNATTPGIMVNQPINSQSSMCIPSCAGLITNT